MTEHKLLDHGYLKLVESWGSDESIISAARMSTDKGFLGWGARCKNCKRPLGGESNWISCPNEGCEDAGAEPGDEKLLRFLWENQHCYDAETEVLTRYRGFVRWADVRRDDELGQWDETRESLVYEKPLELIRRHHQGRMYRVEHGGADLLVTDNHRMFVKRIVSVPGENRQEWASDWALVLASELDQKAMVRYRKHAICRSVEDIELCSGKHAPIFPGHADSRALLRLIGFFIGDGHAGGTRANGIDFHLRKPRKIAFLREVCDEVGWELSELKSDMYVVRAEGAAPFFRSQFYDAKGEKRIPSYLLDMNASDAEAVLDGLRSSDGSIKRGAWEYFSTSQQVAESVQRLVLHAGGAAHVACNDGYMHRVMVLSRMLEPVINQGKKDTSWEQYDGEVFCAHTRTGVLVVRRNGKIVLSGNSTPFEMAGLTIEVKAPIMVFREWHRHRVPFGYNEMSARYVPLPDENYCPTVRRIIEGATSAGKNKQAQGIDGKVPTEEETQRWLDRLMESYALSQAVYEEGLAIGVPKELARLPVPVARYSRMRATGNLRGWLAFMKLRSAESAQWEIRQYSNVVGQLVKEKFPRTWELFSGARS